MRALDIFRPAPSRLVDANAAMERYVEGAKRRTTVARAAFLFLVVIPTLIASLYYGLLASDQHASEARFIVRGMSSPRSSGLELFFRTFGLSRAVDDANAVQSYMLSRDAVRALEEKLPLREIFSRKEADLFTRYPHFWRLWNADNFEALYQYYLESVSVIQDETKGIMELKVVTYRPEDSLALAKALVGLAEDMVNRMNERAQKDAVSDAEEEVAASRQKLLDTLAEMTQFRNRELVVDPSKNSLTVVDTIASLSKELAAALAQVQQMQTVAPGNPAVRSWQAKSDALRVQIAAERLKLGGDSNAFAGKVSTYERLELMRELAEKELGATEASLELARQQARRQQIYIEEVATPNLSDYSTEPQRLRKIATVFVLCFGIFSVVWILFIGAREHGH